MNSIYDQAIEKFNENKYDEALVLFKQLPHDNDEVMYAIATCYKMKQTYHDMLFSQKIYEKLLNKKKINLKLKSCIKSNYISLITMLVKYFLDTDNKTGYEKSINIINDGFKFVPNDPLLTYNMGYLHKCIGKFDIALKYLLSALEKNKTHLDTYHEIINIYMDCKDFKNVLKYIKIGIKNIPKCASLYNNLGLYYTKIDYGKALENFNKALEYGKNDDVILTKIHTNMGHMYSLMGNTADALKQFEIAGKINNNDTTPRQNYLMDCLYLSDMSYNTILRKHYETGLFLKHKYNQHMELSEYNNHKIHIGYVSGDFFGWHPMAYFINSLLNNFSKDKFEIYCYNISENGDETIYSQLIKWRHIKYMELKKCIETIKQDKIDVLIDFSGHTAGNRMDIFANRNAKLQLSYLGYPCITGMPDIDYYLIDRTFDFTGCKTFSMPHCFTHYSPPFIPQELIQPFKNNNYITFCSFNKPSKINDDVVKLWDKVLDRFPDSVLIMKKINNFIFSEKNKNRVKIIELEKEYKKYVYQYNSVDIALDTFPYAGTTTTCECLLMGTPVITLSNRTDKTIHQNTTSSLLINSNLQHFVASSEEEYLTNIQNVINLISQHENYKTYIQQQFLTGYVTDSKQYLQDFESVITFLHKQKNEEYKQNYF
jgi:predicted O-linked N-acetylglucosamine transferase (SPINDLY family)